MAAALTERRKTALVIGAAYVLGFGLTRAFGDNSAPFDVMAQGLFPALGAALTAVALVLIYRTVRIINFAQIGMGVIAAQLFYELYSQGIVPYGVALAMALVGGPLVGLLIGVIFSTLFFRHPRLVLTVGTILIAGLVSYIQFALDGVFHPEGSQRTYPPLLGPWPDAELNLGGTPFRTIHLIGLLLLAGLSLGLVLFFRKTRVGTAVRASAENADRASLLGINVKLLHVGIWTLVGFISCVSSIASMPIDGYNPAAAQDYLLLILPLAAAVLARMTSMPLAFVYAFGIALVRHGVQYSVQDAPLIDIGLVAIIMVGLLAQRRKILARAEEASSWKAAREIRPTPRELLRLPSIRRTRIALYGIFAVVVLGFPWLMGTSTINTFSDIWTRAIIAISLVILTGWSGQISLGQMGIVAAGAFVGGNLSMNAGIPFWFAVPLGGLAGAVLALLIGLPALRIRGLFLAATTLGFSSVATLIFFDESFLGRWVPETGVQPPKLLFLDFEDHRSMYYLLLACFIGTVAAVQALRRSRAGRVLIGLRDNEPGVQSFGIDPVRTRLIAFALSGFLAAFAGALMVHKNLGMSSDTYSALESIQMFIIVVIGGVSSVAGAFLGALYIVGTQQLLSPSTQQLFTGILGIAILMMIPGGLTQVVFGFRDAILRVVAMRRHIVVPSLFADYSPEAWEKRLAPLAPALQTQGLAVLKPEQRYSLKSKVFGGASA